MLLHVIKPAVPVDFTADLPLSRESLYLMQHFIAFTDHVQYGNAFNSPRIVWLPSPVRIKGAFLQHDVNTVLPFQLAFDAGCPTGQISIVKIESCRHC
ncbi:hypothetical protein D3C81_1698990 [compost metagenome]